MNGVFCWPKPPISPFAIERMTFRIMRVREDKCYYMVIMIIHRTILQDIANL